MSNNKVIFLIGFLIAIMPVLGFPANWKTIFYVICGCLLILISIIGHMRRRSGELYLDNEKSQAQ